MSDTAEFIYGNDTVYFAQPRLSQFVPGGSGAGVFNQSTWIGLKDAPKNALPLPGRNASRSNAGVVLRYPQWGIRIHCEKLPDPQVNLVPKSTLNRTYIFIPRDFLEGLFSVYGMGLPDMDAVVDAGELEDSSIPSGMNLSTISSIVNETDDGHGVNLRSNHPIYSVNHDWATLEIIFIRFDTFFATNGSFPVYHEDERRGRVGYDAAVCVQKYEPWIIETYNTSFAPPSILRIVEKGNDNASPPAGSIRGPPIENTRYLNTTFGVAYGNGFAQMQKVEFEASPPYYPSPIAVAFTNGTDIEGYTELDPDRLAIIYARVSAANTLPYLVGSGHVVAQSYADVTLVYATYKRWQLIALPILIWTLGVIGELFVPKLPLNVPRREFGLYSWLALFQSQELQFEAAGSVDKLMSLNELEERFSDKRVKFVP